MTVKRSRRLPPSIATRAATNILLAAALCIGCDDGVQVVAVTGKVTFAGGPCPKPGTITFSPVSVAEGMPKLIGRADFAEDGVFEVETADGASGLVPGEYLALVECWLQPPTTADPTSHERFNLIPSDYRPTVVIPSDQSQFDLHLDVPAKK